MTTEINKLVRKGLVTKKTNAEDRRRIVIAVTPKGVELLRELRVIQQPVNDQLFCHLSADDFRRMRTIMKRTVDSGNSALTLVQYLSEKGGVQN